MTVQKEEVSKDQPGYTRRLEMALELLASISSAATGDVEALKKWYPAAKRGSNYQRALDSLEDRIVAVGTEALAALGESAE